MRTDTKTNLCMKRLLIGTLLLTSLFSCSGKKQYYMSKREKTSQKGYHANSANKIVNENEKNKAINQKASEKNRQKTNAAASAAAAEKSKSKTKKHSGEYKFYFH
ncbi:hypothetical protein CHU_1560 [Cytophaga hutchinsonii ATCC 33406]|uniref:Lipoprotein n=2 Tax=Cytophaga hutchinsonii TaxID=985 RepID=A0A6N4SRB9_CYTH3|nr:hypothetical protein CHU_1560 [Cytophaga hutchinsonii ATCC 33406]